MITFEKARSVERAFLTPVLYNLNTIILEKCNATLFFMHW